MLLESLQFSLNVTLPTIFMILLGVFLRRYRWIDDNFCNMASKIIFNFALPATLFLNVAHSPSDYSGQIHLILSGIIGTLLIYFVAEWWANKYIQTRGLRAIFTQGTFRSNAAILGLALAVNAYGTAAMGKISVFVAVLVILFNVLGVITLLKSFSDKKINATNLAVSIMKNPLIIAVVSGIIISEFELFSFIPTSLIKSADYLAHISLPLALICTGASLNFKQLTKFRTAGIENEGSRVVLYSASVRLIIAPLLMLAIGRWGFYLDSVSLGILFLTTASPVASAVYAMVRNYGGDATVTANLIGVTTIGSIFTSSIGLFLLRQIGWV